jgi:hypothetical protein
MRNVFYDQCISIVFLISPLCVNSPPFEKGSGGISPGFHLLQIPLNPPFSKGDLLERKMVIKLSSICHGGGATASRICLSGSGGPPPWPSPSGGGKPSPCPSPGGGGDAGARPSIKPATAAPARERSEMQEAPTTGAPAETAILPANRSDIKSASGGRRYSAAARAAPAANPGDGGSSSKPPAWRWR